MIANRKLKLNVGLMKGIIGVATSKNDWSLTANLSMRPLKN
jgi:hypothetical protein